MIGHAGDLRPHLALPVLERADLVVETLDEDVPRRVVKRRDEACGRGRRIGNGSAEKARVEIALRAPDDHFGAGDAPQSVAEGAGAGGDHSRVGDGDDIAFQLVPVSCEKGSEVG